MNFNFEKIKRSKFLNYTLLTGSAIFLFKKIPFVKSDENNSTDKKIIIKSNPLSVRRENSGEKNV
jgi:hypothetical protein